MDSKQVVHRPGGTGNRRKIKQVEITTLENGNVKVEKTYFDGQDMVTDTTELTEIGAYVYAINPNGSTSQVCEGLRPTGKTLMAGDERLNLPGAERSALNEMLCSIAAKDERNETLATETHGGT